MTKQLLIEALHDLMQHISTSAGRRVAVDLMAEIEECGLQPAPARNNRYDDLRRSA